jgi:hypothetical protein
MKKLLLIILTALVLPASADPWTKSDVELQVLSNLMILTDWGQTRYIAQNPGLFSEDDRLLFGKHPSVLRVNKTFGTIFVMNPIVTNFLPEKYRPYWQWGTIGLEAYCTQHNFSIGVKVQF